MPPIYAAAGEPRRAGLWIRLASLVADLVFVLLVAMLLSRYSGAVFARLSGEMLRIGQPDTFWRGPAAFLLGMVGNLFFGLPFAALVYSLPEAVVGMSPGKMIMGIRVACLEGKGRRTSRLPARALVKNVGAWGLVVAQIVHSEWLAAAALCGAGIVVLGFLPVAGPSKRALHDLIAGTGVVYVAGSRTGAERE